MKTDFYKYHGNGNDFIFIDNMDKSLNLTIDQIVSLCHRRFGIGSDGLILLEPNDDADFEMVFYNPDGSQSFCGNGSRCALHFANYLGMIEETCRFLAIDGMHRGIFKEGISMIHMHDVNEVEIGEGYYYLNTGSPHFVKLVPNVEDIDVYREGRAIRYNDRFKEEGTNVNFIEMRTDHVRSRTYERGVENETYSSGTGTTAIALAAYLKNPALGNDITVRTKGGDLFVAFESNSPNQFTDIWLNGPVNQVYTGVIEL